MSDGKSIIAGDAAGRIHILDYLGRGDDLTI
jgi:hypothetical protein